MIVLCFDSHSIANFIRQYGSSHHDIILWNMKTFSGLDSMQHVYIVQHGRRTRLKHGILCFEKQNLLAIEIHRGRPPPWYKHYHNLRKHPAQEQKRGEHLCLFPLALGYTGSLILWGRIWSTGCKKLPAFQMSMSSVLWEQVGSLQGLGSESRAGRRAGSTCLV